LYHIAVSCAYNGHIKSQMCNHEHNYCII